MYISSLNWCTARLYNKLALPTWAHSPIHLASYLISSCVYNFRQLFWSIALRFSQHTWLLLTMPKKGAAAQQRRKKLLISTRLIIRPKTRKKWNSKCSFCVLFVCIHDFLKLDDLFLSNGFKNLDMSLYNTIRTYFLLIFLRRVCRDSFM